MNVVLMALAAVGLVAVAVYAQARVPEFTEGSRKALLTRAVLAAVGIGFGVVSASAFAEPVPAILAFFIGFGTVHFPAAFILFVKDERGAGKT